MAGSGQADLPELATLTRFERMAFRLVRRMNQGRWKGAWIADRVMDRVWALGEQDRAERESPVLIEPGKTTGDAV